MKVTPLVQSFAGQVTDVDLTRALTDSEQQELRAALDDYSVLIFRDQPIKDSDQLRVGSYLGTLRSVSGQPYIGTSGNVDDEGSIIGEADQRQWVAKGSRLWHTDLSFKRLPDRYTLLSSRVVPAQGGNTQFADTHGAWEALPQSERAELGSLIAIHDHASSREQMGYIMSAEERQASPPMPQPLVLQSERTGRRSLYLASHMSRIVGWPQEEGQALIARLLAHATQPEFILEVEWGEPGTLVIWDDRQTMHRGMPYRDTVEPRILRRCAVISPGAV